MNEPSRVTYLAVKERHGESGMIMVCVLPINSYGRESASERDSNRSMA